jgi:5-methylcytosine-specific restriction endonuclease McrA
MVEYVCERCGLVLKYDDAKRHAHYKGNNPNCPSCHRVMEPLKKTEPEPAAAR